MRGRKPLEYTKEQDDAIISLFEDDDLSRTDILDRFKQKFMSYNGSFDSLKRRFNFLSENSKYKNFLFLI